MSACSDDTADADGNGELEKEELELAIGSLQSGKLTKSEFDDIWSALNPDGKPFLSFTEFLEGMVNIKCNESLGLAEKFNLTKPNQLMSLVMDTPVAAWENKEILSSFDGLEKFGMAVLNANDIEMSADQKTRLMERANEGTIHVVLPEQAKNLKSLHHRNVYTAFAIGFISCVRPTRVLPLRWCAPLTGLVPMLQTITSLVENYMTSVYQTDGIGDTCEFCWVTCDEPNAAGGATCFQAGCAEDGADPPFSLMCEAGELGPEDPDYSADYRWFTGTQTCWDYGSPTQWGPICKEGFPALNLTAFDAMSGQTNRVQQDEDVERVTMFWSFNGAALAIRTLFEILGLYLFGTKNAVRVANALDMRLLPLNRDRATVAQSLIRAALELGQSNVVSWERDPATFTEWRAHSYRAAGCAGHRPAPRGSQEKQMAQPNLYPSVCRKDLPHRVCHERCEQPCLFARPPSLLTPRWPPCVQYS